MRKRHLALIACLIAVGVLPALAQQKDTNKQKLAELRKTIEGLDWEKVDFAALSPLERCRTLLLLNHALDELGSVALAEADLVGAFLDEQELSDAYAANPPEDKPLARTFEDGRKIAAALLKGPMSASSYTKELSETDEHGLAAYEKMYDATCQKKWDEFSESSHMLRSMVAFLKAKGKLKDYMAWAPTETNRRQAEYDKAVAAQPAATRPSAPGNQPAQGQPAEPAQQQQERTESGPAQQALYAAQQPAPTTVVTEDEGDWYPGWYNGAIDNARRDRPVHRDAQYQAQAQARVQQRQQNVQQHQQNPQQRPSNAPSTPPKTGGGRRQ